MNWDDDVWHVGCVTWISHLLDIPLFTFFILFSYVTRKPVFFSNSWLVSAILLYVPLLDQSPEYYFHRFRHTLTSEDRMLGTSLVSDDVISGNEPITGLLSYRSSQAIWNVTSDWLILLDRWKFGGLVKSASWMDINKFLDILRYFHV